MSTSVRGRPRGPLGAGETIALLRRHGLKPRKGLGQHFVVDPNTVRKVVRLAGVSSGDQVLEVGAGLGTLTAALAAAGARVTAVELDASLLPALQEVLGDRDDVRIVIGDALAIDPGALIEGRATKMVANLPYQIATPLLIRLLTERPDIREYTVMVQREVGERLAAGPGEPSYGAVSAKIAFFAVAEVAATVARRAFYPLPGVDSVVIRIVRRARPAVAGRRDRLFAVVEAGFAQRRKTIRNGLRGAGFTAADCERALAAAGVNGTERAERLGLPAFAALARALPWGGRSR